MTEPSSTHQLPCGNYPTCTNEALLSCVGCRLIKYCSKTCQAAHWSTHKTVCKSRISKPNWKPDWVTEKRDPAFLGNEIANHEFGGDHEWMTYLWGNTPALGVGPLRDDMVKLNPKDICFAACGDARDSITLVNALRANHPEEPIDIVLNDMSTYIQLRNLLILLLLGEEEVQAAIELWFYPVISEKTHNLIKQLVEGNIKLHPRYLKMMIAHQGEEGLHDAKFETKSGGKIWAIMPLSSFRILSEDWLGEDWGEDGAQLAADLRRKATKNPSRKDRLQRYLYYSRPGWRNSADLYDYDGVVAPYHDHKIRPTLTKPNFTMFTPKAPREYVYGEHTTPLSAWPVPDVLSNLNSPAPENDIYGHLYYFVYEQLSTFSRHFNQNITFTLTEQFSEHLPRVLPIIRTKDNGAHEFDLIDVSNTCDEEYIGLDALAAASEMLKPHGIVQGIFINYAKSTERLSPASPFEHHEELLEIVPRAEKYAAAAAGKAALDPVDMWDFHDPEVHKRGKWQFALSNFEKNWNKFKGLEDIQFDATTKSLGCVVRKTVFPWMPPKPPLEEMTEEEVKREAERLDMMILGEIHGMEAYVQWVKVEEE